MESNPAPPTTRGMLRTRPKRSRKNFPCRPRPQPACCHGHADVRHHDDPDGLGDRARCLAVTFFILSSHEEKLDRDPDDDRTAGEFHELDQQELGADKGRNDPQQDRRSGSKDNTPFALLPVQVLDGHGDDHGIVSGQDEVDQGNTQEGCQKFPA